jgi:hypothetical protein
MALLHSGLSERGANGIPGTFRRATMCSRGIWVRDHGDSHRESAGGSSARWIVATVLRSDSNSLADADPGADTDPDADADCCTDHHATDADPDGDTGATAHRRAPDPDAHGHCWASIDAAAGRSGDDASGHRPSMD